METIAKVLAFTLFAALTACVQTPPSNLSKQKFSIQVKEPHRMRFYGKGAGAGMMLMSSMGPMGIAVGVAIDEGIGKEIDKTAMQAGFSIEKIVRESLINNAPKTLANIQTINIDRYGFITQSGENDPVAPQLHITIHYSNGESTALKFPEGIDSVPASACTLPLDQAKQEGAAVAACFHKAVDGYLKNLIKTKR